jgi:hypothetical protein
MFILLSTSLTRWTWVRLNDSRTLTQFWPRMKFLISDKPQHWPFAQLGIYSSGLYLIVSLFLWVVF